MLLRQDRVDAVEVLTVEGPVLDADVAPLVTAVERALARPVRGVVLDLAAVAELSDTASRALQGLVRVPSGWPRPTLVVEHPPAGLALDGVIVVADRAEALAHVDDRQERQREVTHLVDGPGSAAQARTAAAACCSRMGFGDLSDDVVLLVSEMVTNAVRHAAPPVELEIEAGEDSVVVAVCDGSPQPPVARGADLGAEGGRGMLLVDLLSVAHGVRAEAIGKTVWARLLRCSPRPDG